MPELPDITVYIEALEKRVKNTKLERVRINGPFFLHSFDPPVSAVEGKRVIGFQRIGKRVVFCLEDELFLILHLMIAGRLHWKARGAKIPGKLGLAALDFEPGTLLVTEASTQKRASLYVVRGHETLAEFDPGGLEVLGADLPAFTAVLKRENHTLKRALTDPHLFSGVGNAYSDEILHRARLSPMQRTSSLSAPEAQRLFTATQLVMKQWIETLRSEAGAGFPENVTAFRPEMAVHGKYGQPCPVCGSPVQRIVYAQNEANYCATCQTGGKLLADRALSRLLKDDWPRTLSELEELKASARKNKD